MSRKTNWKRPRPKPKAVLRLPDLDQAKSAVLISLTSADAQRGYRHAIEEFVEWYCSEPRLSFSRTVLRYRIHLESRNLAPGTINLRLGAVRRLAYEAADCGLLSSDLAAGIRRVKDRALLAVLLACGLRRHEAVELNLGHIQQREDHWAIVDLKGKGGHTRTIPDVGMGEECRRPVDPGSEHYIGQVVSSGAQDGENLGREADGKGGWHVVREYALNKLAPHDLRRTCARLCYAAGGELEQIQFLVGHVSIQTTERYLGCKQRIQDAVNDKIGIEPPG